MKLKGSNKKIKPCGLNLNDKNIRKSGSVEFLFSPGKDVNISCNQCTHHLFVFVKRARAFVYASDIRTFCILSFFSHKKKLLTFLEYHIMIP